MLGFEEDVSLHEEMMAVRPLGAESSDDAARRAQPVDAVGYLIGGVAHDFNNHLTSILGALSLMQVRIDEGRTAELQRYLAVAVAAARRAAAQTQRLLALARRQPLEPTPVDVNALVASSQDELRFALGPAVILETVLAAEVWPTLCDQGQLEDALLNLAINARDAMPNGGRLIIRTANIQLDEAAARSQGERARPGDYVALEVADTGVGMPQEVIARLFEPFFTTKASGRGTGLGLPMIQAFVARLGGFMAIRSEPGRGTSVRIHLPRHKGTERPADAGEAARDRLPPLSP
jgi:signal transduction histidine kinase